MAMGAARGRWKDGRVEFDSPREYELEFREFLSKGAVHVMGAGLPKPLEAFGFTLTPPGRDPVKLSGMIVATTGGGALVQILEFGEPLLARLRPSEGGPSGTAPGTRRRSQPVPVQEYPADVMQRTTGVIVGRAPPPKGPLAGELANPEDLRDLAKLPLGVLAEIDDVARVTTVGLVRYLGVRQANGLLTLSGGGDTVQVGIDGGMFLVGDAEREPIRASFRWLLGSYHFEPGVAERPIGGKPVSAWQLALEAVKARIRDATLDELKRAIDAAAAGRLSSEYIERSKQLALTPAEERLIEKDLDGRRTIAEIVKLGGMSEVSIYQILFLLQTLGLVTFGAPEGVSADEDPVRVRYEHVVAGDLFAALGLHWSDAPRKLKPALDAIKKEFGKGTPAAGRSPEYAAKLVDLAERAHRRLAIKQERRRYREELGLDVTHAAEHMASQGAEAKARGELGEARSLYEAACDLADKPEWEALRRELSSIQ